ncbi:MAG: hypothetical protein D6785_08665 [Planctomycetota bacterium]|nr:MAG: hypothetical protein D6785_08665 [Planctomycetota bacterium]
MDCREFRSQIGSFYFQDEEEELLQAMKEHFQFCSACQNEYENYAKILRSFPLLPSSIEDSQESIHLYLKKIYQKVGDSKEVPSPIKEALISPSPKEKSWPYTFSIHKFPLFSYVRSYSFAFVVFFLASFLSLTIYFFYARLNKRNPFSSKNQEKRALSIQSQKEILLSSNIEKNNVKRKWKKEYLRSIILIDPDDAEENLQMAIWCQKKQLFSEARLHYTQAYRLDPSLRKGSSSIPLNGQNQYSF